MTLQAFRLSCMSRKRGPQAEEAEQMWFEHVNDYDRWLWVVSDPIAQAWLKSPFLKEKLSAINATNSLPPLDPLPLLGTSDPYSRIAPSKTLLAKAQNKVVIARQVAAQARLNLFTVFPAHLDEQNDALNKAGLEAIAAAWSPQISGERPILASFVSVATNTPRRYLQTAAHGQMSLKKVSGWEVGADDLLERLTNWNRLREGLQALNGTATATLLDDRKSGFTNLTSFSQASKALDDLISQVRGLQSWLNVNWTNVDNSSFETDFATNPPTSLADWTQMASASIRLTASEDPRAPLRAAVKRDVLADLAKDVASDAKPAAAPLYGCQNGTTSVHGFHNSI